MNKKNSKLELLGSAPVPKALVSLVQILLERYAYSEIGGTFILI